MRVVRPDLLKAVELVKGGLSFSDTGVKLGLTRNSVSSACRRAGVFVGYDADRRARFGRKQSQLKRLWWAKQKQRSAQALQAPRRAV